MKKVKYLLGIFMMVLLLSLTACGKKTVTYTTSNYLGIEVSGLNGKGIAKITTSRSDFYDKVNEDLFNGEGTDIELARIEIMIYESVKYEFKTPYENLSNGDDVTVTFTSDNEALKEYGVAFDQKELTYTVEGLKDPVELDAFNGLTVTFNGTAPNGSASIIYNGSEEFVKNNVIFNGNKKGLSNGDTVTVTATCNQQLLDDNIFTLKETQKQYTVEGLSEMLKSTDNYDMSAVDQILKTKADDIVNMSTYSFGEDIYSAKLMRSGNLTEKWSVKSIDLKPEKTMLLYSDRENNNMYVIFWNLNVTAEKKYTNPYVSNPDGYSVGDTDTFDIYIMTYADNIILTADNKINSSHSKTYNATYGNSLTGNQLGIKLDNLIEMFMENYPEYSVK